jgi:hypothetical protein
MANQSDLEKAESLMARAYDHLDARETKKALKLGKELISTGYSGGFEILALCHEQGGEPKEAIVVLEEGTRRMPEAWPLWRQP